MSQADPQIFERLGREAGCKRLAQDFYARVAKSAELKPLFPGKSVRCATEEFAAFLIQFLEGDADQTQYRWWLSLRESHARFKITGQQRAEWLKLMNETVESLTIDSKSKEALTQFFRTTSSYVIGNGEAEVQHPELGSRWDKQRTLDRLIDDIANKSDAEAMSLAVQFESRPSVLVGIFARMMEAGREPLINFVLKRIESDREVTKSRFNGRTLLHFAASSSCLPVVLKLLDTGVDPNILDNGGHSPLYRAAGGRDDESGAAIVAALVKTGARVDLTVGVSKSTPLHQAARFGKPQIAKALLAAGANPQAKDKKGLTPLDRAKNCRRPGVAAIFESIR